MTGFTEGPWRRVAERVLVARCEPHGVNIGLVVGDDRAALIDAGSSPAQGAALLASAREQAGIEVSHVVVTHAHHDHWFGIAGMTGVVSIAHEDLLAAPEAEVVAAARAVGMAVLPEPDVTLTLMRAVDLGGVRLEILHFGPAHTHTDLFVVVPGQDVIFTGDTIESDQDPCISESTDLASWPTALDGVLGASGEATRFVPGHGPVVDREFCFRQRAQLAMLHSTADSLYRQGRTVEEALGSAEWPFGPDTVRAALDHVWATLTRQGVPARRTLPLV